ncbi:hypothetical protein ACWEPC_57555, partial [Nonomuraea sp. NPDC004297]
MSVSYTYAQPDRVSERTRARVREAAARLGYPGPHPGARSLRRGRTGSLGVVLGEHLTYAFEDPHELDVGLSEASHLHDVISFHIVRSYHIETCGR